MTDKVCPQAAGNRKSLETHQEMGNRPDRDTPGEKKFDIDKLLERLTRLIDFF